MVNFGYPYNDIVICKDSTDYLDFYYFIVLVTIQQQKLFVFLSDFNG